MPWAQHKIQSSGPQTPSPDGSSKLAKLSTAAPPEGFSWTSHNLRKGVASASNAIGARLTDIRYAGGWSTNSTVLEAKYINFAMLPTPATRLFFGYLCKNAPSEGC